jgi:hypothetical protein
MSQLAAIFALPLGQLLLGAVIILAVLSLMLWRLAREMRIDRDHMIDLHSCRTRGERLKLIAGGRR